MKKYLDPGFCYCFPPHNYYCDHCRKGLEEMANFEDVTKLDMVTKLLKDMGRINGIIEEAEEWAERQLMPEDRITLGALKDVRRVARRWKKMTPAPEGEKE